MATVFKKSNISSDLNLYTGLGLNSVRDTSTKKLTINKIFVSSSGSTSIDIFLKAYNSATNREEFRHIIQALDLEKGFMISVIPSSIDVTTDWSLVVGKPLNDGVEIDVYCDYEESTDAVFVNTFATDNY